MKILFRYFDQKIDFNSFTRPQLVKYLKNRDFPTSLMKKEELLQLWGRAATWNVPVTEADDSADCHDRFRSVSIADSTFKIDVDGILQENLSKLPPVELSDVLTY